MHELDEEKSMQRVAIIGQSSIGKTTLANQLGILLNIEITDLDEIYWQPGWTMVSDKEGERRVQEIVTQLQWIIAGIAISSSPEL